MFVSLPPRLQWVLSSLPKERTCISASRFMCGSMYCLDACIWSPDNVLFAFNKDNKSQSVRRLCMTSCAKGEVRKSVQLSTCQKSCVFCDKMFCCNFTYILHRVCILYTYLPSCENKCLLGLTIPRFTLVASVN